MAHVEEPVWCTKGSIEGSQHFTGSQRELAERLSWCGVGRGSLSTMSRRRRRTVIVGNHAPAKIGGRLGAGELEQRSGKLIRGSVKAVDG
jgi:hypothetical protein